MDPDWDTPLKLTVTPASIIDTVLATADSVHTGEDTCVDQSLVVMETTAIDDQSENYCRFVEQEYVEEEEPEATWHDWAVEIRVENVHGHRALARACFRQPLGLGVVLDGGGKGVHHGVHSDG